MPNSRHLNQQRLLLDLSCIEAAVKEGAPKCGFFQILDIFVISDVLMTMMKRLRKPVHSALSIPTHYTRKTCQPTSSHMTRRSVDGWHDI